jgi:hypothetical protein
MTIAKLIELAMVGGAAVLLLTVMLGVRASHMFAVRTIGGREIIEKRVTEIIGEKPNVEIVI